MADRYLTWSLVQGGHSGSKKLLRALRGGERVLEYRTNEDGDGGVFACERLDPDTPVELCPLLEVDRALRNQSNVLKKLTVRARGEASAYAIPLGFARLYASSPAPNLSWGYLGDSDVLLWTAEEVLEDQELTLNFSRTPPQPTAAIERKRPLTLQAPPAVRVVRDTSALTDAMVEKFRGVGNIVHGASPLHGRGVFATADIPPGQMVESCPVMAMDGAGAQALLSYRWGTEGQEGGPLYIPMGLGCLYNHSERPNVRAKLDRGRMVLEFVASEQLHRGQEILVNYGASYFSDQFEGHRKGELASVEEFSVKDIDMLVYSELQHALIHAFRDAGFQARLAELHKTPDLPATASKKDWLKAAGQQWKRIHDHVQQAQLPILERFGLPKNHKGAMLLEQYLMAKYQDERNTAEMRERAHELERLVRGTSRHDAADLKPGDSLDQPAEDGPPLSDPAASRFLRTPGVASRILTKHAQP